MYVMKVRGQDIYLAIDENNNMYETENIEEKIIAFLSGINTE